MAESNSEADATVVEVLEEDGDHKHRFSFKRLLQFMGPGILMSIAYIDPGNLESDLQVGAQAGYVLLWLLLLSTAMGLVVQMQAAKLGVVTGRHLAQHCRRQYPKGPRLALWLMAEVAIIGSDVQEVIGSAIALALLSGGRLPLWGGVLLTAADSFALLFIERLGVRVLEGFFAGMVGVMVLAFGVMYGKADVPAGEVVRGFTVPTLPRKDLPVAVALMGSLIMPHNIYLHSALVQSRRLGSDRPAAKREALTYFGIESALSLVVAVVINLFITAVFAAGFYGAGVPEIGLQNAGRYLGHAYGPVVVYIWALGLLAAGQSSTMTGTYTGQFVMGGYLNLKVSPWARVTITRAVAIAPTLIVALLCGRGDGTQLDALNQGLNLLQSMQLPFALIPVLTFTSSRAIMGEFANSWPVSLLCWAIAGLVIGINGLALYEVAYEAVIADPWVTGSVLGIAVALYLGLIGYLVAGPQSALAQWMGWATATLPKDATEHLASGAVTPDVSVAGPHRRGRGSAGGAGRPKRVCPLCKAAGESCAACRGWKVAAEAADEDEGVAGPKLVKAGNGVANGIGGVGVIRAVLNGVGRRSGGGGGGGLTRAAGPLLGSTCALCGGELPPPSPLAASPAAAANGGGVRKVLSTCSVGGGDAAADGDGGECTLVDVLGYEGPGGAPAAAVAPPPQPVICPHCGNVGVGVCAGDGAAEPRPEQRCCRKPRQPTAAADDDNDLERPLLLDESDMEEPEQQQQQQQHQKESKA